MDGAAAGLCGGNDDVTAILLQDSGCRPVYMAEHGIGDAADEQSDFGASLSDCGQEGWQWWFAGAQSGKLVVQSLNFGGQQSCESAVSEQFVESEGLQESCGQQCPTQSIAPGEESVEYPAVEPVIGGLFCGGRLLHFDAEGFQQSAVLNSTGAGGFAAAAVEAGIEVSLDGGRQLKSSVDDGAHEVDATARAIIFIAGFDIGGAGCGAESAVDTVEKAVVGDGLSEDRERAGGVVLLCGHWGILTEAICCVCGFASL